MPRGGHFGGWFPLPKDFFRSRWKRFYKRSYRVRERGGGINSPDLLPPYGSASMSGKGSVQQVHHDIMPSPWKLQYSINNYEQDGIPKDQRRLAQNLYAFNVKSYMDPYYVSAKNSTVQDVLLRCLDAGRRGKSDSGLGRPSFGTAAQGSGTDRPEHVPAHIYNVLKEHSSKGDSARGVFEAFKDPPDTFAIRRLYELCEEKELVWDRGQQDPNKERRDEEQMAHGRFPRVDEQASLVDELALKDILRLRYKTNRRRHPKWIEITYQYKKWHQQYLRRKAMLDDEVKARMGVIKQGA